MKYEIVCFELCFNIIFFYKSWKSKAVPDVIEAYQLMIFLVTASIFASKILVTSSSRGHNVYLTSSISRIVGIYSSTYQDDI